MAWKENLEGLPEPVFEVFEILFHVQLVNALACLPMRLVEVAFLRAKCY